MKYRIPQNNVSWAKAFLLTLLFVGSGSVFGAAEDLDRFSWKGPVVQAGLVRIENSFGDVRLRHGGDSGELEVAGVLQQLRSDGVRLVTQVVERDGTTVVTVGWASKPGVEVPARPQGDRTRADLAVLVPSGMKTELVVPDGLVEVRGVRGDATLKTESGDIRIHRHFGAISASTKDGSIEAVLLTGKTNSDQVFESVTGSVEIWVSADAQHDVTLATSGSITTDFTMEISHDDSREPDKTGRAVLGKGGPELRLNSKRGALSLRRVPVAKTAQY